MLNDFLLLEQSRCNLIRKGQNIKLICFPTVNTSTAYKSFICWLNGFTLQVRPLLIQCSFRVPLGSHEDLRATS